MKWEMEILSKASYPNWFLEESKNTRWTHDENKLFESALAIHDKETPDRWQKIAAMIPGKTVMDVIKQYKELLDDVSHIEAGLIPIPGYTTSSFTLEWVNNHRGFGSGGKRSSSGRPTDQERKKGVPWTEEEHRLFLLGLKKYGKGDWRNISRNYVISRTPTQVASHAQKYFIRQLSGGKDKRRSSIHDITTVNCIETTPQPDNNRPHSPDQSAFLSQPNMGITPKAVFDWNQPNNGTSMVFGQTNGNMFVPPPYGIGSYGMKPQGQNLHRGAFHGSHVG
ncbi:SANT/Myb domain [Macleaya cordata]|uniref:SANT/Myb domain n=1 Tax=Macleaya cordata TaxID=56857 RepID=A0A200Q7K3_MACCD|nr:SANT/Myb domain [Macleaya cordata]